MIYFNLRPRYRNCILLISLVLMTLVSSGCGIKNMGQAVKYSITGEHFLTTEQYGKGISRFKQEVINSPESALANFYYGRFLLGEKQYKKSLPYLKKARDLSPKKVDFHFWVGVAYGTIGHRKSEKTAYEKALSLDKKHLQSLIYLGNNQLQFKRYKTSLKLYKRALEIWPASPTALYNRALILSKLGRKPEALEGWLEYLSYYPSGAMARYAVDHLNDLGDYTFRNYTLLSRTVTVEKILFIPFTEEIDRGSQKSLEFIGVVASNMHKGRLQIVVYQLKNKELAKKKAIAIKKFLTKKYPTLKKADIGISWFDVPETIRIAKKSRKINDSVSFFISK